jgi:hypothetical protein
LKSSRDWDKNSPPPSSSLGAPNPIFGFPCFAEAEEAGAEEAEAEEAEAEVGL